MKFALFANFSPAEALFAAPVRFAGIGARSQIVVDQALPQFRTLIYNLIAVQFRQGKLSTNLELPLLAGTAFVEVQAIVFRPGMPLSIAWWI